MEKRKVGKGFTVLRAGCDLHKLVKEGLCEKVTLMRRRQGSEPRTPGAGAFQGTELPVQRP